jgi:hypothetical protein
MTDLIYNHITLRIPGTPDHLLINLYGLLTCGPSAGEAFNLMYNLELACRTQVDTMAARDDWCVPPQAVLERTADLYQPGTRRPYGVLEWQAPAARWARRTARRHPA